MAQSIVLSFAALIAGGTLLLSLPVCQQGAPHRWVDDLFTAASAVCVTGTMTIDLGTGYTPLGQAAVVLLVQLGGLGYMTVYSFRLSLFGRRLSLQGRFRLQEAMEQPGQAGLAAHVRGILALTCAAEALGFLLLATQTVPEFGWVQGAGVAAYFAVCAPNNAGMSMFSDGLSRWQGNPVFLLTVAALIVYGGLGYNVVRELVNRYLFRRPPDPRWVPLVSIVVSTTVLLLALSTGAIWWFERHNAQTLGPMEAGAQWLNAYFMAVQPRTAGFNSIDTGAMTRPSQLLMVPLMFFGTGPGGTGGGIKLTSLVILLAATWAAIRAQEDVTLPFLKRRVDEETVRKALAAFVLSSVFIGVVTFAVALLEPLPLLSVGFEVVSSFATAGLSLGITARLSDPSKLLLIVAMLAGRVGMLMLVLALVPRRTPTVVHYPKETLLVG